LCAIAGGVECRGTSRPVVFRGTELKAARLAQIQRQIDSRPGQTRQSISRAVCRLFGWRCDNGAWAVRSARELLVGLDERGLIRLPGASRPQGRPRSDAVEMAAALLGSPMDTPSPTAGGQLLVRPIGASEQLGWRAHMERFHYLGDVALVGESLRYAAFIDGQLVALLGWGSAALHNAPRDRYLGWGEASKRANLCQVVNNVRFLILPWMAGQQRHLASQVLGANLRRLARDWQATYGHSVLLAETFVDRSRFVGTCYRASNWLCVGETEGWSRAAATIVSTASPSRSGCIRCIVISSTD
jgi:hypothetical protein